MSHTFEAFVDMMEYSDRPDMAPSLYSERYEVDAESTGEANKVALFKAEAAHPKATEFDVRVTRLLH